MGEMRAEIDEALAEVDDEGRDAGAVALLRTYADLIDDAGVPGKYAEALDWVVAAAASSEDVKADRHARAILLALSRQTTVSDIGPKMLATMEALQMTPRARKAATQSAAPTGAKSPMDELREQAAKRRRRAGNVG